jgi:hypothetical protein
MLRRACLPVLCLLVLAGCAAAPEFVTPQGAINQVYAVVDVRTMAAIRRSVYLAGSFANLRDASRDGAAGQRADGIYLTGQETTVALFSAQNSQHAAAGQSGLGIGLDTIGETAGVRRHYRALTGLEPTAIARSQLIDALDVPWFLSTLPGGIDFDAPPDFAIWTMEYQPAYFVANRNKAAGSDPYDVSRRRYNSNRFDAARLMRDVVAVTFDVATSDAEAAIELLEAAGLAVTRAEGKAVARSGEEIITINLVDDNEPVGLREIAFSLNRDLAAQHSENLGASELVVGPGRRAVWHFGTY